MKPEILAPAGSMEALKAAVHAGADAVYLGGSRFGARAYADNFDEAALTEAIEYSHFYGVKVYLTINTLFRDDEIVQLFDYLNPYYQAGLDAVIVQDLGIMYYVHKNFPNLPIHASTQMTITTEYAYLLLKDYGVTRIVPARELSLKELGRLKSGADVPEVEVFVQGALCYCYSGQCLMSSMLGGRSGNRGRCAQTCRLPYTVFDEKGKLVKADGAHILSPKDLCGLEAVPDLIEAGVDSFKIEGRMKKPEYVAVCVNAYRKIVDSWYQGTFSETLVRQCKDEMAEVFNRGGFTKGYFFRKNGREMMSVKNAGNTGVIIGEVSDIRKNQIHIHLQKDVYKGDILVLDGKKESITLTCNTEGKRGSMIILNAPKSQEIRKNQTISRMWKSPLMTELTNYINEDKLIPLWGKVELKTGLPAKLILKMQVADRVYSITQTGDTAGQALERSISEETVRDKIGKTGTRYYFETLETDISPDAFYPLKALKDLRRGALKALENEVLAAGRRDSASRYELALDWKAKGICPKGVSVMVSSMAQYEIVKQEEWVTDIYLDLQYFKKEDIIGIAAEEKKGCFLVLPPILRQDSFVEMKEILMGFRENTINFTGVVVRNIDELAYLKQMGYQGDIRTDYSLYVMNDYAEFLIRSIYPEAGITLPVELNGKQIKALHFTESNCEIEVYGHQQLMVSAQCLQNTLLQCGRGGNAFVLKDRYNKNFFVSCICKYCYNLIYNGIPTILFDLVRRDFGNKLSKRLHFIKETPEQVKQILDAFLSGEIPEGEKTRGHYNRGVE